MAPCGWIRTDGSGHAVILVVLRRETEVYSVSIINPCGEGAGYHAREADPAKGKVVYCVTLAVVDNGRTTFAFLSMCVMFSCAFGRKINAAWYKDITLSLAGRMPSAAVVGCVGDERCYSNAVLAHLP